MQPSGRPLKPFVSLIVLSLLTSSLASSFRTRSQLKSGLVDDPLPRTKASDAAKAKKEEMERKAQEEADKHLLWTTTTDVPDYNKETPVVIWGQKSVIPVSVECIIALSWIGMVMSLPMYLYALNGWSVTKTDLIIDLSMVVSFVGGLFLFTNVILFQSVHFEMDRPLTIVECIYLMAQILTTVGYGDITPAKPRGQVFVGIYVLCSLLFIANALSEVVHLTVEKARREFIRIAEARQQLAQQLAEVAARKSEGRPSDGDDVAVGDGDREEASDTPEVTGETDPVLRLARPPPAITYQSFAGMFVLYLFFVVLGVCFFSNYPGENKTILESIYMSVITLSTVGFGAVTPQTEAGKVFASFWMVFGSAALAGLIGSFIDLTTQIKAREKWTPEDPELMEHYENTPAKMGSLEFMEFALLSSKIMTKAQLEHLEAVFKQLKPVNGTISKTALRHFLIAHPESLLTPNSARNH